MNEIAIENLGELATEIKRQGENGEYMLTMGGDFESSLILLDIWNNENFPVDGEIIIGVPARDIILVTGSNDTENIKEIKSKIKSINESGDHIVSDKLFIYDGVKFIMHK